MAKYYAIDIARWFIFKDRQIEEFEGSGDLTLLKLLKLLYYAEGCSLASGRGSLFPEKIEAWEHGPVVREIYDKYSGDPYHLPFNKDDMASIDKIRDDDNAFLDEVYRVFGQYSAWGLRNMTHQEKPWLEATSGGKHFNGEISRKTMQDYFKENYIA